MSLRQRLLLVVSLTVVLAVAAVAWIVSMRTRQVFAAADQKRTAALVNQFRRQYQASAEDVAARVQHVAASERLAHIASELEHTADPSPYLMEAAALAREYELDYLEIINADGSIISSAQWPARFGYQRRLPSNGDQASFLMREELPDGPSEIGLFAVRTVPRSGLPLHVIGGRRLDRHFLSNLAAPADTQVLLYLAFPGPFDPHELMSADGEVPRAAQYQPVLDLARSSGNEVSSLVYLTQHRQDSVDATAIPLKTPDGSVLAILVVANARRSFVELQQHIRAISYGVAGVGILLAILASLWISSRISRPVEELAAAASEVAAGHWDTKVEITSRDEVGELARTFNYMTEQLSEQRERLVQSERVAAWRELARRLAHELKNPLFPLQLTVENLIKARDAMPAEFDEIFRESTATLTAEIANLKNIIARFSDFSKMPKPQLQEVDLVEMVRKLKSLYEPLLAQHQPPIGFQCRVADDEPLLVAADPDLLHRALSNLVLNAMDAMPQGGTLTVQLGRQEDRVQIQISDTGSGMTSEECERLFTPYYTTKQHGTGLGLAIVQAVVSDHQGTIRVESKPGSGSTFVVELPGQAARVAKA